MRKNLLIMLFILIIGTMVLVGRFHVSSRKAQNTVRIEFKDNSNYFREVAGFLLSYPGQDLRISDNPYVSSNDAIINEKVYQTEAGKKISELGYDLIRTELEGGVYFYRYRIRDLGRGLMYYPNGFRLEYNKQVIDYIPLTEDGWYYFAEQ